MPGKKEVPPAVEALDLRALSAEDAARTLFAFVSRMAREQGQDPNIECSLLDPKKSKSAGYGPFWTVSWEAGPYEWGVLLSLGESMWLSEKELRYDHKPEVLLHGSPHWYTEPYYSFNLSFVVEVPEVGFDVDRDDGSGRSIVTVSGLVGEALIKYFDRYPERLKTIDRRKFEELIAELFTGFGYDVELTRPTRDGGKDIIAVKRIDDISVKYLLECKRPDPAGHVAVSTVRELLGVTLDEGATKGILVTTTHFSADAKNLFERHKWKLEAKAYADVVSWIQNYVRLKTSR